MNSQTHRLELATLTSPSGPSGLEPLFAYRSLNLARLEVSTLTIEASDTYQLLESGGDELLVVLLAGQAEVSLGQQGKTQMGPGAITYQPAGVTAQIHNLGQQRAVLLLVRWRGTGHRQPSPALGTTVMTPTEAAVPGSSHREFRTVVFDHPTDQTQRLHCFVLRLLPGATVPLHQHRDHDVVLIGLEGQIETHDGVLSPVAVAYYQGGEPHGIFGVGEQGAKALALEFYGQPSPLESLRTRFRESGLWQQLRRLKSGRQPA